MVYKPLKIQLKIAAIMLIAAQSADTDEAIWFSGPSSCGGDMCQLSSRERASSAESSYLGIHRGIIYLLV